MPLRFQSHPFLLILVLLLMARCQTGKINTVQYGSVTVEPRFGSTIQTRQNLVFRFSKALVKPEEIGEWDTTRFMHIQPAVVGQFKWSAVDELIFSPDKGFAFATGYSAHPSAALSKLAGEELKGEGIRFATEQLRVTSCQAHWYKNDQGSPMLLLATTLNQAVLPDELLPAVQVFVNGKPQSVAVDEHFPSTTLALTMPAGSLTSASSDPEVEIRLVASKLPATLKKWLAEDTRFKSDIPAPNRLEIYGVEVEYEASGTALLVAMSQSVADFSSLVPFGAGSPSLFSVTGVSGVTAQAHKQGMKITGGFPGQGVLELTLFKGLTGVLGASLSTDKTLGFRIGTERPTIRFSSKRALYLPRFGTRSIGFEQEGVKQIQLSVYQVFPNNMLSTIATHGNYYSEENDYEYDNEYYSEYQTDYGTLMYHRSYRVSELQRDGNQYLLPLDFDALPGQKGIFMVTISDEEEHYIGAKKMVCITDVGLMAKSSVEEIWVQAQSIETGKPQDRLRITVIGKNNQPLYTGETNPAGELSIPRNKLAALGADPLMLVAENQSDFSYLHFGQTRLETSRFPVDGVPWTASGWQAEVFGPRNLYKPGEAIDLRILLRDRGLAAVPQTPLLVKVMSPDGKMVQMLRTQTGDLGEAGLRFTIPAYLKTGTYQAEVYGGARELLATHALHIETFKPLPLVIQAGTVPPSLPMGSDWKVDIHAETMFGAPAAERPVEVALLWETASFQPEGYSDYNFYLQRNSENNLLTENTTTNLKGQASVSFPLSQVPPYQGLLDLKAKIQVSDESNTPVYKTITTQLLTQPGMLGYRIKGNQLYYRRSNRVDLVCLNAEGKPVSGAAHIEVYSTKWSTVMEKAPEEPSGYRYVSRETKTQVASDFVRLSSGKGSWSFVPVQTGNYEVIIKASPSASSSLQFSSYVYESENQAPPSDEADTEGNVEINPLRPEAEPGSEMPVRFTTPFNGQLRVTVEQNRILKTFSQEVRGKSAVVDIPITRDMAPNVYISATLTRSIGKDPHQNPLTVAYGYASIPVKLADKELKTEVKVASSSVSGVKLPITVELTGADGESGLALAVVDEGILSITNYRIPDPFLFFHSKKALAVETFAMYGKIFKALGGGKSTTGGDAMYLKMAQNEVDKEEVSIFMTAGSQPGELKTPGKDPETGSWLKMKSGGSNPVYTALVDLPSGFAGKIRIMAITYTKGKVGLAEKQVIVADPVTIKASAPDYLFPGDRFDGSATFFNTSKASVSFQPMLQSSGNSGAAASWPSQLTLAPGQVTRLPFSISGKVEGKVNLTILAKSPKQTYRLARTFDVKAPYWLVRHQVAGELKPGESQMVSCPSFLNPNSLTARLEISNNPFVSLAPAVQHLLRYPYGCLEQTISAAFPLVYLPDEWLQDIPNLPKSEAGQKWKKSVYVADAIQKVSGLQTYNGGFAYWPGSDDPTDYYSVYATHFLWEARQAGFAVDPQVLQKAQKFLEQSLANRSEMANRTGYIQSGKKINFQTLDPAIPYSLYTLALMGKIQRASLLQWKSQPEKLDQEGRYMIACALLLSGDADGFQQLVPHQWTKTAELESGNRSFAKTSGQEEAFVLAALSASWPNHPAVKLLATRLRNRIALQSDLMSTQEEGMALVALGRLIKANASRENQARLSQNGKALLNQTGKQTVRNWAAPFSLENRSKSTPLYYWVTAQGASASGNLPETDEGIEVRKMYYDAMGRAVNPASMKLNDLVVVRLSLVSKLGKPVHQVALVDVVPACLRIENGRLGLESGFTTVTQPASPDYLDIRRDRIHFFCTAGTNESSYYYTARVVGMGQFNWGPAEAQSMYQSTLFSRHGAARVLVSARPSESMAKR